MADLDKKIDRAIRLLSSIPTDKGDIEVSYSGGKDSDVILELAKMAGIPYRAIYKNTTIDPPGTIKHAKDMGAEIVHPEKTFFELVRQNGTPNRFMRFCCQYLKEYKILDRSIQGIRCAESSKRASLYKEPEMCRKHNGGVMCVFTFLYWIGRMKMLRSSYLSVVSNAIRCTMMSKAFFMWSAGLVA